MILCFGVWVHVHFIDACFSTLLSLLLLLLTLQSTCGYCWQGKQEDAWTCIQSHWLSSAQEDRRAGSQPRASSFCYLFPFLFLFFSSTPSLQPSPLVGKTRMKFLCINICRFRTLILATTPVVSVHCNLSTSEVIQTLYIIFHSKREGDKPT